MKKLLLNNLDDMDKFVDWYNYNYNPIDDIQQSHFIHYYDLKPGYTFPTAITIYQKDLIKLPTVEHQPLKRVVHQKYVYQWIDIEEFFNMMNKPRTKQEITGEWWK